MKSLKSYLFVIGCILVSLCSHAWAADLPFGQTQTGTIGSAAQTNSYTFSANANDLADFTMAATSGNLSPKIQLYSSAGKLLGSANPGNCYGSTIEMNTVTLPASGTYTVLVSDCSDTNTGNYVIYAQRTNNPSGAANLPFGQTETGAIGSAAQSNTYTFSANANDVVDFTMTATSGSLSPKIRLYNPGGTLLNSANPGNCYGSTIEMNTVTLPASGAYTVLLGDCSDTNAGSYEIYAQRTANPSGAANLVFGQTQTGTISLATQSNSYTFSANANDLADFTMVATSGSLSPKIRLYNPAGTLLNSANPGNCYGSTIEMNTVTLPASDTYTVLVSDCSDTNTGNYVIYAQRTTNPSGAASLPFGQTQTGSISSATQSNSYTFSANANDLVDFTMVATSGSLSPKIRLYNPAGTLLSSANPGNCYGSTIEMNTVTLPASGTYTVLLGDCGDTNTGNYAIYAQRTNNPAGPIGLLWGQVQPGMIGSAAQSDSYTFPGSANDVVDFTMATTRGSLSPKIRLYNPAGTLLSSVNPGNCYGSTIQMNSVTLPTSGAYTVLVGDCGDTSTGNYNLSSQCFGTCPLPAPALTFLSPTSALAGGSGFTLTVNGSNFVSGPNSVVYWNGSSRITTYVSSTQLTAAVLASDIATAGTFPVTVLNPNPLIGPSNAITFTVNNPVPAMASLSPSSVTAGGSAFTLTVNGSNFVNGSVVNWNGSSRNTTYISSTQLQAAITATDIAAASSASVTVFNPSPGGGTSAGSAFTVNPPPAIASLSPSSAMTGGAAFTLTINGTNFLSGAVAQWSGTSLVTTFVSATQLTAAVPASLIASGGSASITVVNPGGATSNAATFTINALTPSISGLSPNSATAGGPSLTLTVNGSGFLNGSTVQWNGSAITTSYLSVNQLTASVPASRIANSGTASVTVVNPGGATSNVVTFTVNGLGTPVRFGSLAHIAVGGWWTTVITLVNTSASPVAVSVVLHGDDGSVLTSLSVTTTQQGVTQAATAGSVNAVLNPNTTFLISAGDPTAQTVVGWADVLSSGPVGGFAIFRSTPDFGSPSEGTVPLQTQTPSAIVLPYDDTAGFVMGVALANLSTSSASITATVWDDSGTNLGSQTITIAGSGHTSFVLPTQIPLTAGKRGIVRFQTSSTSGITGLGLRFSPFGTFTSVPTM